MRRVAGGKFLDWLSLSGGQKKLDALNKILADIRKGK